MRLSAGVVDRAAKDVEKAAILAFAALRADGFVHRFRILTAKIRDVAIPELREIQGDARTYAGN
jgi:hypothetical protein